MSFKRSFTIFQVCLSYISNTEKEKEKKRASKQIKHSAVKPDKIFLFKLMLYPQPYSTYTINNYLFNCILIFQECNTVFSFKIGYLNFSYTFF